MSAPCNHTGQWQPAGSMGFPAQGGGGTIYVAVVCGECGEVWLRLPLADEGDIRRMQLRTNGMALLPGGKA